MVSTAAATGPIAARRDGPHPMNDILLQSSGVAARVLVFGKGEAPPVQPGPYLRDKVIRQPSWTTRMIQARRGDGSFAIRVQSAKLDRTLFHGGTSGQSTRYSFFRRLWGSVQAKVA